MQNYLGKINENITKTPKDDGFRTPDISTSPITQQKQRETTDEKDKQIGRVLKASKSMDLKINEIVEEPHE